MTLQKTSHNFTKIVFIPLHTNLFHIVLLSIFLTFGTVDIYSQDISKKNKNIAAKQAVKVDTKTKDTQVTIKDNIKNLTDSTKTDSIKPKKAFLDGKVK